MIRAKLILLILIAMISQQRTLYGSSKQEDLIQQLEKAAQPGNGISAKEREIAKNVQGLGSSAIPYLLPLLKHENKNVRKLASYTLRDINGLNEEHLDVLIESGRSGNQWILPAIARIGTPKAIEFLIDELKKEKKKYTQVTYSFELLGGNGIPYLMKLYKDSPKADEQLLQTVNFIFGKLGDNAEAAVDSLTEIACDKNIDSKIRIYAIRGLGQIGPKAQRSIPALQKLAQEEPDIFSSAVNKSMIEIGSREAVPILLEKLDQNPNIVVFRDIAQLREKGQPAGSTLVTYLGNKDWDIRVGAARAIGYIGYTKAIPYLIDLLLNDDDWRLVYVSAESLGRLRAQEAVPSLVRISQSHWYPPVREAATKAIDAINGKAQYGSGQANFPSEFFEYEHVGRNIKIVSMESMQEYGLKQRLGQEGYLNAHELQELAYTVDSGHGKKVFPKRTRVPQLGIKVEDGSLVPSRRGEGGAELVFINSEKSQDVLIKKNIRGIYKMPSGIVAVTGLAHLSSNRGLVYKITRTDSNKWSATPWKVLPGAPISSALLDSGALLVNCKGGSIEISSDGEIKMVRKEKSVLSKIIDFLMHGCWGEGK